ncbi:MAG: insulinase family protein [Syntrophobacterales bacterium]|jgi:predicted Zn-dependent peptidase|nr:insulinase family protein [Syntrophobacterales bacterium]
MVNKTILANGIRVVSEEIRHVQSVSIGVWIGCGSRHETKTSNGIAHFIEHMLFKGTGKRSPFAIVSAVDSMGGVINASTGKENTVFYIKIPAYHLDSAIELLADILNHSLFRDEDIEKEKSVICQEIRMVEDSPDEYIHDVFDARFWRGHSLAFPVAGTCESIQSFNRKKILRFFKRHYGGNNLVISVAGQVEHSRLAELITRCFGAAPQEEHKIFSPPPSPSVVKCFIRKDLEQVHFVMGCKAPAVGDPMRYACIILNALFGGGMSSRLFQEIREKKGLVYDIQSYLSAYHDAGMMGVYGGTDTNQLREVIRLIRLEMQKLQENLLAEQELHNTKEMVKGNFILSMESTDSRMNRLAKNEISFGRYITCDEVMGEIDGVTKQDVCDAAREIFALDKISLVAIGKIPPGMAKDG